jgi:hypothetical protein
MNKDIKENLEDKGFVPQVLPHRIFYFICYRNVHLQHQGPHGPAVVTGDELLQAGQYGTPAARSLETRTALGASC